MPFERTDQGGGGERPRVVIVGGGFGGLAALERLRRADLDVMLIERTGFHTFQPLLYQVATGGLNPGDVAYPARKSALENGASYRMAEVRGVDLDRRRLLVDVGNAVPYDYLVLAAGSSANFFGIDGAERHARTIYSISSALNARQRLYRQLEAAASEPEHRPCSAVVVGGGPTGVEMAGTLAEIRNGIVPLGYPELSASDVRVILIEQAHELLEPFRPSLRRYAATELRRRGVELRLGSSVAAVTADGVVLQTGERIEPASVVWAAGVRAATLAGSLGLPTGGGGRITVGPDLSVPGHPEVFVIGDMADVVDATGRRLPQLAQPAIQCGHHAAAQIRRLADGRATEPFRYRDKGMMATIGRRAAVVQLPAGIRLTGAPAWFSWVTLHIATLLGARNRVAVLSNLAWRYLNWPSHAKVLVGG